MKMKSCFIWSDYRTKFNSKSSIDLYIPRIIRPGHSKYDGSFFYFDPIQDFETFGNLFDDPLNKEEGKGYQFEISEKFCN